MHNLADDQMICSSAIAAAATAGIAAAPVAAIEAYRAHSFEKKFWKFISKSIRIFGEYWPRSGLRDFPIIG